MNRGRHFIKSRFKESLKTPLGPKSPRPPFFTVTILATAAIVGGYYAYPKLPVVKRTLGPFFQFFKPDYSLRTAQMLLSRGNTLRVKGRYKEAETAYAESMEKFALIKDNQGLGNAYTELGILRTRTRDYKSAKKQFQKAVSYFEIVGDANGLGYANINLAQLHFIQRHFKSAKKYLLIGQKHYQASSNQEGLGNVALGLGNLYIAKRDYPKATQYFTEAESVFQLIGNKRGLVNVYNSLSHAFRAMGTKRSKEEAARYHQLAKSIELNTHARDLPKFSIQESFKWLTTAFNQHRDIYEDEQDLKAKQETEQALR